MTTVLHNSTTPSVSVTAASGNDQPQLVATIVPDEQRISCKRAARTVLTGMCYSVGSATRQGSSSPTRFIGQSAMTSRT